MIQLRFRLNLVSFYCDGSHLEVVVRLVDTLLQDICLFFSALFPRLVCY
jgi:hypothetical protein